MKLGSVFPPILAVFNLFLLDKGHVLKKGTYKKKEIREDGTKGGVDRHSGSVESKWWEKNDAS